ncbi:hypothetical protein ACFGY8_04395 [Pasteurella multocida]
MKIIKKCLLDGNEVELESERFVLELSNAGRGFITVKTDKLCQGKSLIFEIGEYDAFYRWFDGFVEREAEAEKGYKRLFVREKCAIFERTFNCSHRHITLAALCQWLSQESGLKIKYPDKSYSQTSIPLFTHHGNGYQLLHSIGRLFNIPEYIWQQSPDGSVFVGSWQDSRWAEKGREIEVSAAETLSRTATALTIPINARIRPGFLVNGQRITKVFLEGDNYELEWQLLNSKGQPIQKSPEKRAIEQQFPELAGGYHLSRFAKIIAVADPSQGGEVSDPFRPKYAVDVQILDEHGNEDKSIPVYPAVQLPVSSTSSQGGDFAFPEVGTIVELGFVAGRSDKPVIRSFYAQGKTIPQIAPGEMLRQQRPGVFERTDGSGNMHKETDQRMSEKSFERIIETENEIRNIGTTQINIDSNSTETVGGNKRTAVLGNIEEVTAANKSLGVGGNLEEKIKGTALLLSEVENKMVAPLSHVGTEGQNIFRILEAIIQNQADIAKTIANHTHKGGPTPDQRSAFNDFSENAMQEKAKLSPIIV